MFRVSIVANSIKELRQKMTEMYQELCLEVDIDGTVLQPHEIEEEPEDREPVEETYDPKPVVVSPPSIHRGIPEGAGEPMPGGFNVTTVTGDQELDSRGIPWDQRIHASSRSKNTDGTWRQKRGVDLDTVAKVEKQYKSSPQTQREKPEIAPAPVIPFGKPEPQAQVVVAIPFGKPEPTRIEVPAVQVPVAAAPLKAYENIPVPQGQKPAHTVESFKQNLASCMAQLHLLGAITPDYVESLKAYFGIKEMWEVARDPAKVAELYENFCSSGLITKV